VNIQQRISAANFSDVDKIILETPWPCQYVCGEIVEAQMRLVPFGNDGNTAREPDLAALGLRAATIHELVAFHTYHPDGQLQHNIITPDPQSIWHNEHNIPYAPCLTKREQGKALALVRYDDINDFINTFIATVKEDSIMLIDDI